jgi:hypothetical protein
MLYVRTIRPHPSREPATLLTGHELKVSVDVGGGWAYVYVRCCDVPGM